MLFVAYLSACLLLIAVTIHLACLHAVFHLQARLGLPLRLRVGAMALGAIVGHLVEIAVFAVAIHWLAVSGTHGALPGRGTPDFGDSLYHSAVAYTTLGSGDVVPSGHLRFLTAAEALTGLVLIAWTAAFLFLGMQLCWQKQLQATPAAEAPS